MSKIDKDKKFTIAFTLEDILDIRLLIKAGSSAASRAILQGKNLWHVA